MNFAELSARDQHGNDLSTLIVPFQLVPVENELKIVIETSIWRTIVGLLESQLSKLADGSSGLVISLTGETWNVEATSDAVPPP
jgi:hypothetical protein